MTSIDIQLDGDNCWPDLKPKIAEGRVVHAELKGVALLPDGEAIDGFTGEHKLVPIITLRVELPDGTTALAQVKLDMMKMVTRAMDGRLQYIADLKAKGGRDS